MENNPINNDHPLHRSQQIPVLLRHQHPQPRVEHQALPSNQHRPSHRRDNQARDLRRELEILDNKSQIVGNDTKGRGEQGPEVQASETAESDEDEGEQDEGLYMASAQQMMTVTLSALTVPSKKVVVPRRLAVVVSVEAIVAGRCGTVQRVARVCCQCVYRYVECLLVAITEVVWLRASRSQTWMCSDSLQPDLKRRGAMQHIERSPSVLTGKGTDMAEHDSIIQDVQPAYTADQQRRRRTLEDDLYAGVCKDLAG